MMSKLSGPSLQKECNTKAPVKSGDVVVTGPGKLKCRHVLHAVAPNHSQDKKGEVSVTSYYIVY